jgi:hypothetical protein
MIKQHHSVQLRKPLAMEKLGDIWEHYRHLQEILSNSYGSDRWMRITGIANERCRYRGLAKRCLNRTYVHRLTKLHQQLKLNIWYISADFQEAKKLFNNGCPQLEAGINYKARDLLQYRGLVRRLGDYPCMDDCNHANHANRRGTTSSSVLPADHEISVRPPFPDKRTMLPSPIPPTKTTEKRKDESNIGGLLMQLAEEGSEDGTNPPTEKDASRTQPGPPEHDRSTIPPALTEDMAGTNWPALTWTQSSTSPESPTNP